MHMDGDLVPAGPRGQSLALLEPFLVAALDLNRHIRHAQCNLVGSRASALREPLNQVAVALNGCCDLIVAQVSEIGGGSDPMGVGGARSFLSRFPLDRPDAQSHAAAVVAVMEELGAAWRAAAIDDAEGAALVLTLAGCVERHAVRVRDATMVVPPCPVRSAAGRMELAPAHAE